jgi:hypothetical protein
MVTFMIRRRKAQPLLTHTGAVYALQWQPQANQQEVSR